MSKHGIILKNFFYFKFQVKSHNRGNIWIQIPTYKGLIYYIIEFDNEIYKGFLANIDNDIKNINEKLNEGIYSILLIPFGKFIEVTSIKLKLDGIEYIDPNRNNPINNPIGNKFNFSVKKSKKDEKDIFKLNFSGNLDNFNRLCLWNQVILFHNKNNFIPRIKDLAEKIFKNVSNLNSKIEELDSKMIEFKDIVEEQKRYMPNLVSKNNQKIYDKLDELKDKFKEIIHKKEFTDFNYDQNFIYENKMQVGREYPLYVLFSLN